jgi:predicted alpha/beta-fold hydrolase
MPENSLVNSEKLAEIREALKAKPFHPHQLFRSGHAQTILGFFYPRSRRLQRALRNDSKRLFEVEPGVRLLAHCRWHQNARAHPTLVLVHGLEGSSNSIYMLGTATKAFRAGFNVVRLNLRTCGDSEHLTSKPYHAGVSSDLRAVVDELIMRDRLPSIFIGGFSLGGNLVLKCAGEYAAEAPVALRGAFAVSPSIDLSACADAIEKRSNRIYEQRFLKALKKRVRRMVERYPELYNLDVLSQVRTIRDFDAHFTAVHGGFENADDYYARASARSLIAEIRIPTLIIHAQDDPFIPFQSFRDSSIGENPFVTMLAPSAGGHVGFISRDNREDRFWAENRIVEFCKLIATG